MDPGMAPERTALAWQRTALSIIFGSLLLARLTVREIGFLAIIAVGISIPLALWVYAESRRRYQFELGSIVTGGKTTAAIAIATVLGGCTELTSLLRS